MMFRASNLITRSQVSSLDQHTTISLLENATNREQSSIPAHLHIHPLRPNEDLHLIDLLRLPRPPPLLPLLLPSHSATLALTTRRGRSTVRAGHPAPARRLWRSRCSPSCTDSHRRSRRRNTGGVTAGWRSSCQSGMASLARWMEAMKI